MFKRLGWLIMALWLALDCSQAQDLPRFSHVFLLVFENSSTERIVGNPRLPTFNRLAAQGTLAVNHHGVTHPSLPNYLALISGSFFGTHSDNPEQTFSGPTLPEALETRGLSWKGYFQSLPSPGYQGHDAGWFGVYVKRHNPFMLFPALANNPERAARSVPLEQLRIDLEANQTPNFALIVPDLCHGLHGNINCLGRELLEGKADRFLNTWVSAIRSSRAWDDRAVIIITFDEGNASDRREGGGRIPLIVLSKGGPQGRQVSTFSNHYGLLRTLTDAWGLPPLGESSKASPLTELFVQR